MKIACIIDEIMPSQDTMTVQVIQTLAALGRAGADVTLFMPKREITDPEAMRAALSERYHVDCQMDIELMPMWKGPRVVQKSSLSAFTAGIVADERFDLLYTRLVLSALISLGQSRPILFETYRPLTEQLPATKIPFRLAANSSNFLGIVTHSEFTRQKFIADGIPPEKVRAILNGFDEGFFPSPPTPQQTRAALGIPERPTVVYAGRIAPLKRIDILLDALEEMPEVQLVLAGEHTSEESQPIVERAKALGAHLLGYVTGPAYAQALHAGELVVIPPSRAPLEKYGRTVLPIKTFQYLASGRVVVTGDNPDTAELLLDDVNSVRVPPDDPAALRAAMVSVLADPERQQRLGEAAFARSRELTWTARGERLLEYMQTRLDARDQQAG